MRAFTANVALVAGVLLTSGCYSVRDDFRPVLTDVPAVVDAGELEVVTADELIAAYYHEEGTDDNYRALDRDAVAGQVYYGQLGAPEDPGTYGGATYQFRGTGGTVCVVADPEAMFWSREISPQPSGIVYDYDDAYEDDGDVDLSVGLSAYYTGSPGEEVGGFDATYTDGLGVDHTLAFNECNQYGYFGDLAHAGRGTFEYCQIDTSLRPGVEYTVLLSTFSLPLDDSILNYGTMVFDGPCGNIPWWDATMDIDSDREEDGGINTGTSECALPNEVALAEPDGVADEDKSWFAEVESAFCAPLAGKLNQACEDHLDDASPPCTEP